MIHIENAAKSFTLHNQGAAVIPVMTGASLSVASGECVALTGPSGSGKSTLMRMIYGNYLTQEGRIIVGKTDVATAQPREILSLRRKTLGYVSQFLRVVPRVPTAKVVAEPLLSAGIPQDEALDAATQILDWPSRDKPAALALVQSWKQTKPVPIEKLKRATKASSSQVKKGNLIWS